MAFPASCEESLMARSVVELTEALNVCTRLPPWANYDVTDAILKEAGKNYPRVQNEVDAGNSAGSMLMLAMLLPEAFGVPGGPSLTIFGPTPPEGVIHIQATKRAMSATGADNRRTNIIEGLLNYWQDIAEPCRSRLMYVWLLMGRAFELLDPFNNLLVKDMARNSFSVPEAIYCDAWWAKVYGARSYLQKQIEKLIPVASRPVADDAIRRLIEDEARGHWYIVLVPRATFCHDGMAVGCSVRAWWHGDWHRGTLYKILDIDKLQILWNEEYTVSNLDRSLVQVHQQDIREISMLEHSVVRVFFSSPDAFKFRINWDEESTGKAFLDTPRLSLLFKEIMSGVMKRSFKEFDC
jgi:hypothetical protein